MKILLNLCVCLLSRTTRRESYPEGISAAAPPVIPPTHNRTGSAMDAPSNLVQGQVFIQQL
jgi:hypothetical protein